MVEATSRAEQNASCPSVTATVVARLGALPVQAVTDLYSSELAEARRVVVSCERDLARHRVSVSDALHDVIATTTERSERNFLLGARRDLFNERRLSDERATRLERLSSPMAKVAVRCFGESLRRCEEARRHLETQYDRALRSARVRLQRAVESPAFQNGVLLSSETLFANLAKFSRLDPGRFRARDEQIERGVLRYLTRASMKATPFSTFCTIVAGRIAVDGCSTVDDVVPDSMTLNGNLGRQRSMLRLNKSLYAVLWAAVKRDETAKKGLQVTANPTLTRQDNAWSFLTPAGDREIFRKISRSEALDLVGSLALSRVGSFEELVRALVNSPYVDASPEEASEFVGSLVNAGFLAFQSAVSEQEVDWDVPFCHQLRGLQTPLTSDAEALLVDLRVALEKARTLSGASRAALLGQMRQRVREVMMSLNLPPSPRGEALVYEDATAEASVEIRAGTSLQAGLDVLRQFVSIALSVAYPRGAMATMRHFVDTTCGDEPRIPLLKFYEAFYREHLRDHIAKEQLARAGKPLEGYSLMNPMRLEFVAALLRAQAAMGTVLREAWRHAPDADEVIVSCDALRDAIGSVPEITSCRSSSVFATIIPARVGRARIIVPSGTFSGGYGKFFSRFLYLLPPEVLDATVEANRAVTSEWLADIGADAAFNANLHPAILPFEIGYPTSDAPNLAQQISCVDIDVARDPDDRHALILVHRPTGQRVHPVDLGFLSVLRRPPLYQLLIRFMPAGSLSLPIPESAEPTGQQRQEGAGTPSSGDGGRDEANAITYRPRFVIDDALVVARRRWTVPSGSFPRQGSDESAAAYFARANRWREHHGIPREVYVRIRPLRPPVKNAFEKPLPGDAPAGSVPPDESDEDHHHESPEEQEDVPAPADAAGIDDEAQAVEPDRRTAPGTPVAAAHQKVSRDWWKPQYVDFESPLLLKLFARMPSQLSDFVMYLEERYPADDDLLIVDGERRSMELILQVDFPKHATTKQ